MWWSRAQQKGIIFVWDRCIMLLLCRNQYLSSCLCTHIHWRTHKPLDRKVRLTELCTPSLAGNDQLTMAWQWLLKHSRPSTPYQSTNKHIQQCIFKLTIIIIPNGHSSSPSSQSLSTVSRCPNPILRFQFAAAKTLLKSIQIPFTESTWNLSYFSRSISWMAREIFSPTSCFQYMLWVIRSLAWRNILRTR